MMYLYVINPTLVPLLLKKGYTFIKEEPFPSHPVAVFKNDGEPIHWQSEDVMMSNELSFIGKEVAM